MSVHSRDNGDNAGGYGLSPWVDWVVGLAGIWMLVSPWVFHYTYVPRATWTSVGLGALLAIFAFPRRFIPRSHWIWWVILGLGILALFAPWALNFYYLPGAFWPDVTAGAIAVIVAAVAVLTPRTRTPAA